MKSILTQQPGTSYVYGYEGQLVIWLYGAELADIKKLRQLKNICEELIESMQSLYDPAYFSSIFKKYTGLSPKEFKQMHSI